MTKRGRQTVAASVHCVIIWMVGSVFLWLYRRWGLEQQRQGLAGDAPPMWMVLWWFPILAAIIGVLAAIVITLCALGDWAKRPDPEPVRDITKERLVAEALRELDQIEQETPS